MKQTVRKNHGTMIVPFTKANVGASGVVIAKLPIGARIHSVNVTVDEAFSNADNDINVGVTGATTKFQSGFALDAVAGNTSTRQHTATEATQEVIMSILGAVSATGTGNVTIDYALPTTYSVEY